MGTLGLDQRIDLAGDQFRAIVQRGGQAGEHDLAKPVDLEDGIDLAGERTTGDDQYLA